MEVAFEQEVLQSIGGVIDCEVHTYLKLFLAMDDGKSQIPRYLSKC
jgi:hypothetical protein